MTSLLHNVPTQGKNYDWFQCRLSLCILWPSFTILSLVIVEKCRVMQNGINPLEWDVQRHPQPAMGLTVYSIWGRSTPLVLEKFLKKPSKAANISFFKCIQHSLRLLLIKIWNCISSRNLSHDRYWRVDKQKNLRFSRFLE